MKDSRAVYYVVNNNADYLTFAKLSINSLRRFNRRIKIYLFIYGASENIDLSFFYKNQVVLIKKKRALLHVNSLKYFVRDESLSRLEKNLLFLDADTIVFDDIDIIFEKCNKYDFYAREESESDINCRDSQLFSGKFKKITKQLGVKIYPVFNTGVMLFNNASYKKLSQKLSFYKNIYSNFKANKIPYPCENPYIIGEITFSIIFGKAPILSYGILDNKISPWYKEYQNGIVKDTGVVMHFWKYRYTKLMQKIGAEVLLKSNIVDLKRLL